MSQTVILGLCALYLLVMAMLTSTSSVLAKVVFCVIPGLLGTVAAILTFGKIMGWPI